MPHGFASMRRSPVPWRESVSRGEEEEAKEAVKIAKEEEERNIELDNLIYSLEEARNERDFWQRIVNSLESRIKSFDMEEA